MSISPAGKPRVMVAQTYSDTTSSGYGEAPAISQKKGPLSLETDEAMNEDIGSSQEIDNNTGMPTEENMSGDVGVSPQSKKKTLTNYVFEKLRSYNYPGRRLEEFKSKFVKESVSPQGIKDIQIEIPDKKYPGPEGIADTVEGGDLKEIAREIQESFGLNFNGADRSDGKWTVKFTSEKMMSQDEEAPVKDNLEDVYGSPATGKSKGKNISRDKQRAAYTIQEMIKIAKNDVVEKIIKSLGA